MLFYFFILFLGNSCQNIDNINYFKVINLTDIKYENDKVKFTSMLKGINEEIVTFHLYSLNNNKNITYKYISFCLNKNIFKHISEIEKNNKIMNVWLDKKRAKKKKLNTKNINKTREEKIIKNITEQYSCFIYKMLREENSVLVPDENLLENKNKKITMQITKQKKPIKNLKNYTLTNLDYISKELNNKMILIDYGSIKIKNNVIKFILKLYSLSKEISLFDKFFVYLKIKNIKTNVVNETIKLAECFSLNNLEDSYLDKSFKVKCELINEENISIENIEIILLDSKQVIGIPLYNKVREFNLNKTLIKKKEFKTFPIFSFDEEIVEKTKNNSIVLKGKVDYYQNLYYGKKIELKTYQPKNTEILVNFEKMKNGDIICEFKSELPSNEELIIIPPQIGYYFTDRKNRAVFINKTLTIQTVDKLKKTKKNKSFNYLLIFIIIFIFLAFDGKILFSKIINYINNKSKYVKLENNYE